MTISIDPRVQLDPADEDLLRAIGHDVYVSSGYAFFSTSKTGPVQVHRFLVGDEIPPDGVFHVDHINGDRLDNRRSNLRVVSPQVNQINRKHLNRNNTSGHRGVSRHPRKGAAKTWRASITVNGKHLHLGVFATLEEAVAVRRAAERVHFPEECPIPEVSA